MVKKLEVKGNERISVETIVVFGDISLGKNYEESDVNSLILSLYFLAFSPSNTIEFIIGFSSTVMLSILFLITTDIFEKSVVL